MTMFSLLSSLKGRLRTRIAPTPSGFLHIGNAFSFVTTWYLARKLQGKVFLRIDDFDQARCRREYLDDIFEILAWLGIFPDEGPKNTDDFLKNYSQTLRLATYQHFLEELKNNHYLFACICSRKQLEIAEETCLEKNIDFQTDCAWKLKTHLCSTTHLNDLEKGNSQLCVHTEMPYFVVRRKDRLPAYQVVSLVDDLAYGINFIVRGNDLWASSFAQMYMADLLGKNLFQQIIFLHHPLLLEKDGQKLSKSQGASPLKRWLAEKRSPQPIYEMAENYLRKLFPQLF